MKRNIDRREFLKTAAGAAAATSGIAVLGGCKGKEATGTGTETPSGEMTYRTNP